MDDFLKQVHDEIKAQTGLEPQFGVEAVGDGFYRFTDCVYRGRTLRAPDCHFSLDMQPPGCNFILTSNPKYCLVKGENPNQFRACVAESLVKTEFKPVIEEVFRIAEPTTDGLRKMVYESYELTETALGSMYLAMDSLDTNGDVFSTRKMLVIASQDLFDVESAVFDGAAGGVAAGGVAAGGVAAGGAVGQKRKRLVEMSSEELVSVMRELVGLAELSLANVLSVLRSLEADVLDIGAAVEEMVKMCDALNDVMANMD